MNIISREDYGSLHKKEYIWKKLFLQERDGGWQLLQLSNFCQIFLVNFGISVMEGGRRDHKIQKLKKIGLDGLEIYLFHLYSGWDPKLQNLKKYLFRWFGNILFFTCTLGGIVLVHPHLLQTVEWKEDSMKNTDSFISVFLC